MSMLKNALETCFKGEEPLSIVTEPNWGRILVIDDSLDVCNQLTSGLRQNHYVAQSIPVKDGMNGKTLGTLIEHALKKPLEQKERQIDIILWDVNLGGVNNGPAIAMRVDDAMKDGKLPYALSEIYTGIDNTDQIKSMIAKSDFLQRPFGYLKDKMETSELAKILQRRVNVARRTRATLTALHRYNEQLQMLYQNIAEARGHLSTTAAKNPDCNNQLLEVITLLERGISLDYRNQVKPYSLDAMVTDLEGIRVPRVINDAKRGKDSEYVPISVTRGFAQSLKLISLMRSVPAIMQKMGRDAAMYTEGDYQMGINSTEKEVMVSTRMTLKSGVPEDEMMGFTESVRDTTYLRGLNGTVEGPKISGGRFCYIAVKFPLQSVEYKRG